MDPLQSKVAEMQAHEVMRNHWHAEAAPQSRRPPAWAPLLAWLRRLTAPPQVGARASARRPTRQPG